MQFPVDALLVELVLEDELVGSEELVVVTDDTLCVKVLETEVVLVVAELSCALFPGP